MGHEQVRRALVAHYAATVPAALDAIRSDGVPIKPRAYLAQDHMPDDDRIPCVCVATTDLLGIQFERPGMAGPVRATYTVEVACFVIADAHRADDRAAIGRDRLVEAIRQATLGVKVSGLRVDRDTYSERTSPTVVDAKGRPLTRGVAIFNVSADEAITGPPRIPADPSVDVAPLP